MVFNVFLLINSKYIKFIIDIVFSKLKTSLKWFVFWCTLVGSKLNHLKGFLKFGIFSLDKDLDESNYNLFRADLNLNNFITSFEFIEEDNSEQIKKLEKMLKDLERQKKKTPGGGFAKMKIKKMIADLKGMKEDVELDEVRISDYVVDTLRDF